MALPACSRRGPRDRLAGLKAVFARTVMWKVAATLASAISSFIALKLYNQYFIKEGLFAAVGAAQQILGQMPVVDGGFRLATNRALLAEDYAAERLRVLQFAQTLTWLSGLAGAVIGVTAMAIYSFAQNAAASGAGLPFLLSFGAIGGAALVSIAQVQMLTGLGLQRRVFSLNALNSMVFLAVVWTGLRAGMQQWAFIIAMAASQSVVGIVAVLMAKAAAPEMRIFRVRLDDDFYRLFRIHWREAWAAFRMQVVIVALYSSDVIVLNVVTKGAAADLYALLARLLSELRKILQSADESLWPMIAAKSENATVVSGRLLRLNGWLYGAAMSAAAVTVPVFIMGYTPEKGRPGMALVVLFALRFLITGLSSQPSYYLYGKGRFDLILKYQWREFGVAVALSIPLGLKFGTIGIAVGYLLATAAGTLWSFPKSYADGLGLPLTTVFGGPWLRAVLGATIAAGTSLAVLRFGSSWPMAMFAGACGATMALVWALGWAKWRSGSPQGKVSLATLAEYL